MEGFNEQVVKRKNNIKNLFIKIISIVLLITIPVLCCVLAVMIPLPYLVYVGLFILIGGIYVVWYIFSQQKVDFEYSVVGDELKIDKVISLRKRKKVCRVPISEIEQLEKGEKSVDGKKFSKSFIAAADFDKDKENYYAVYNSPAYGRSLLVFTPNDKILQAMKPHLKKDIVLKLFYHRNVE